MFNELCVPRNISDKRKKLMCKNFNEANTYRIFYECDYNAIYNFSFMSSEFYLLIVLIILGIAFIIIYYNNYLIKKKQKPFNLPSIFPETLFPISSCDLGRNFVATTTSSREAFSRIAFPTYCSEVPF